MLIGAFALTTAACGGSSGSGAQSGAPKAVDVSPAGDIPDTQAFVAFSSPGQYTVKYPEGWSRTDVASGATFTDKLNSMAIEASTTATAPTVASARTTDVPALRAASHHFRLAGVVTVRRNAGDALLITYRADGPADPVTGKRRDHDNEVYEFWKSGTLVTITLSSPHGADNVDPWRIVTNSFAWLR
jgi:hypothetical protein